MMGGMKPLPVLAFVLLCGCAGKPTPADAQRIVGDWVVVDFQSPGATEDRGQRRKRAVITEGTWAEQFQGDAFEDFEYALDPTQVPKEIDLIFTDANGRRLTVRGIYELPDADHLRVCLGTPPIVRTGKGVQYPESIRPTAFEATTGPLVSYRRRTEERGAWWRR